MISHLGPHLQLLLPCSMIIFFLRYPFENSARQRKIKKKALLTLVLFQPEELRTAFSSESTL